MMSKLIYIPLEHIDGRYTVHLDRDIENYLIASGRQYVKVMPTTETPPLPKGMFLNAPFTSKFKSLQMAEIASMYERGEIQDSDQFFFSDLWFPGLEHLAYMNYFCKVKPRITGIIHAGSFTDTDFVRDLERWAKNFEDIIFDISDKVYVASEFIKNDILKKRIIQEHKLVVSGLPLDFAGLDRYSGMSTKKDIVVFNGRLCDEKQPWLFDELARQVKQRLGDQIQFVKTQEMNLDKDQYYSLLSSSKAVVSYALQENFGFGIAEATYLGCQPVLPDRLVYPELYPKEFLYDRFEQSVDMVCEIIQRGPQFTQLNFTHDCFDIWFRGLADAE
jgi:glycosyltransferase involved in cell wall biosynthesis